MTAHVTVMPVYLFTIMSNRIEEAVKLYIFSMLFKVLMNGEKCSRYSGYLYRYTDTSQCTMSL